MAYDSPSVAMMQAMTSQDVTDALNSIRHKSKDHLCEGDGRAGIYHASKSDATLAIKFVDEPNARWHVQNTELFHFFELPFVPCRSLPLEKRFDPRGFCTETDFSYQTYAPATHVVLMPFVKGKNFKTIIDKTKNIYAATDIQKLNTTILQHATPICLAHFWDCLPKNVIAHLGKDANLEEQTIETEAFTFVDAQNGLLSLYKQNEDLSCDVQWPIKNLEHNYTIPMSRIHPFFTSNIRHSMSQSCKFWEAKIKNDFHHTSYDKPKQLQENLVQRANALRRIL